MPPRPFLGVVIDRQLAFAVRAGEPGPARMDNPDVYPTFLGRQLYPSHLPRRYQSQQMAVQLGVAHHLILPPTRESRPDLTHWK